LAKSDSAESRYDEDRSGEDDAMSLPDDANSLPRIRRAIRTCIDPSSTSVRARECPNVVEIEVFVKRASSRLRSCLPNPQGQATKRLPPTQLQIAQLQMRGMQRPVAASASTGRPAIGPAHTMQVDDRP
jgi:hypothetical protein